MIEATAFRKDVKRAHRRGFDLQKLAAVIKKLQYGEVLPLANRPAR